MWTEKYRPQTLDEVKGQDAIIKSLKEQIKKFKQTGEKPFNMLFSGPAGVGKTTTAHAFAHALGWPIIELNASDERGINVIREKVKNTAKLAYKQIIYLDEADNLTSDAQPALRRIMEQHTHDTVFIMSVNYLHKIIDPLQSRCVKYTFKRLNKRTVLQTLVDICKNEGVPYKVDDAKNALLAIVDMTNGDLRRAISILEAVVSSEGTITEAGVLMQQKPIFAKAALDFAMQGDFDNARTKIEESYAQSSFSSEDICQEMYKVLAKYPATERRLRLFAYLTDVEYRCKIGCDVPLQLVGFMAFVAATGGMIQN